MQKYLIATILVVALASCAPASKDVHKKKEIASEYGHLESRKKSINAAQKVNIGKSEASFYYDNRLWSVKNESISKLISPPEGLPMRIFFYMTKTYK